MEKVRLKLQQLRSMVAEANRRQVAPDRGFHLDLPEGIPRSGKKKKSWRQTEMPAICLGAASLSPTYLTVAPEEYLSTWCPEVCPTESAAVTPDITATAKLLLRPASAFRGTNLVLKGAKAIFDAIPVPKRGSACS